MTLLILLAFLGAVVVTELVLQGAKLQSALGRVALTNAIFLAATGWFIWESRQIGIVTLFVFWAGAFLSWFGVRSHLESSVLLRMLYLLRQKPMNEEQLLRAYESHYGEAQRLEELIRAGLIQRTSQGIVPTKKGKSIVRFISGLS